MELMGLLRDASLRRSISIFSGIAIDVAWAIVNLAMSVASRSWWCLTLGCYYLLLSSMRILVCKSMRDRRSLSKRLDELQVERVCGIQLAISILVLSGIVTLAMHDQDSLVYPEIMVYGIATFTFYSLVCAIVGFVRSRGETDVLMRTNCRVSLSIALISVFTMQIAMFHAFAKPEDATLVFVMPILTGTAIALAILLMGIACIRDSLAGGQPL